MFAVTLPQKHDILPNLRSIGEIILSISPSSGNNINGNWTSRLVPQFRDFLLHCIIHIAISSSKYATWTGIQIEGQCIGSMPPVAFHTKIRYLSMWQSENDLWLNIIELEKVLLDPIFIFTHVGSCFETFQDVSASQLEVMVT